MTNTARARRCVVVVALAAALVLPATAGAHWWSWGYNYVGPSTPDYWWYKYPTAKTFGN